MLSKLLVICTEDSVVDSLPLGKIEVEKCAVAFRGPLPTADGQLVVLNVQHIPTFEQVWLKLKEHHSHKPLLILVNFELFTYFQAYLKDLPKAWDWLPLQLEIHYLEAKIRQFWQNQQHILIPEQDSLDSLLHLLNGPISPLEGYLDLLHESEELTPLHANMVLQALFCLRKVKQRLHYLSLYRLLTLKQNQLLIQDISIASVVSAVQEKLNFEFSPSCFVVQDLSESKVWRADKEMLEMLLVSFLRYLTEHCQQVQIELKELSATRLKRRLAYSLEEHQALGFVNVPWSINSSSFLEIHFQFQGSPELAQLWKVLLQTPRVEYNTWLELELLSRLLWEGLRLHHAWIYVETSPEGVNQLSWGLPLWP